ncbi:MAG: T9SS type A sorting domain-containing protein, partial [Ferruginibacter sp.]
SKIVVVKISTGNSEFKIFPNPVTNQQINIHADEMAKGQYQVLLYNQQGQQIMQRIINHPGGLFNQVIRPDALLPDGIYYLQITGETEKFNLKIFIK